MGDEMQQTRNPPADSQGEHHEPELADGGVGECASIGLHEPMVAAMKSVIAPV